MADQEELVANINQEREIPVFTVIKNNVILKNIFLIDKLPSESEIVSGNRSETHQEFEETLVVGRHPDCEIRLEHPSISRFHLRLHSKPSLKSLTVTDLSSVHGTWISGIRIEPNVRTEVNEGDTLMFGASSRLYKLHWIRLSQAYDVENPFVPPMDMPAAEKQKDESNKVEVRVVKNENREPVGPAVMNGLESFYLDQNTGWPLQKEVPSASPVPDDTNGEVKGEEPVGVMEVFEVGNEVEVQVAKNKDREPIGPLVMDGLGSFYLDENTDCFLQREVPSASHEPNEMNGQVKEEELVTATEDPPSVDSAVVESSESMCLDGEIEWPMPKVNSATPPSLDMNFGVPNVKSKVKESVILKGEYFDEVLNSGSKIISGLSEFRMCMESHMLTENRLFKERKEKRDNCMPEESLSTEVAGETLEGLAFVSDSAKKLNCSGTNEETGNDSIVAKLKRNEMQSPLNIDEIAAWNFWPELQASQFVDSDSHAGNGPFVAKSSHLEKENQCSQYDSLNGVLSERKYLDNLNLNKNERSHCEAKELWSFWSGNMGVESIYSSFSEKEPFSESENQLLNSEYQNPKHRSHLRYQCERPFLDSPPVRSSFSEGESFSDEENQLLKSEYQRPEHPSDFSNLCDPFLESPRMSSGKKSNLPNNRARRVNSANSPQIQSSRSKGKKIASTSIESSEETFKYVSMSRVLLQGGDDLEEKCITRARENCTPNSQASARKLATSGGSYSSPICNMAGSPSINPLIADFSPFTDKENQTPKGKKTGRRASGILKKSVRQKKSERERAPLQLLRTNSPQKRSSPTGNMTGSPSIYPLIANFSPFSDKENQTPKVKKSGTRASGILKKSVGQKMREGERAVFQPLHTNSPQKRSSPTGNMTGSPSIYPLIANFSPFSDKENQTPKGKKSGTRASGILKKSVGQNMREGERAAFQPLHTNSPQKRSSPTGNMTGSPSIYPLIANFSPFSDKENQTPKGKKSGRCASGILKKSIRQNMREGERAPFHILHTNSPKKSAFETIPSNVTMRSSINCTKAKSKLPPNCSEKRVQRWNVIVDSTCLLNKEAVKALQLLEGIQGTRLIIPGNVIRELDNMKRQASFFRRRTEVYAALEWIEECMVRTNWWIHIQSFVEEGRVLAPTPPATPQSLSSGALFSAFGAQSNIASPTAEDYILEYALSLKRKKNNDEQLILLTDDVTLKVKAMSEALICETAEEFRYSLVNPFSERFLWSDSSPRGQTWTCLDDVVLRESFYPSSLKTTSAKADSIKGLKLILLHNSQYGRISSVC